MRLGGRVKSVAALDPAFIERAAQLLTIRARRMYAEVACQRPRRSTMPDQKGRALHPLDRGLSAEWHCLHCDGAHDGRTMAKNLWHCPDCGATPIDIFPEPFWNGTKQSA
jgi:rubrerythrin